MLKSKKDISPIPATLLLIVTAVAAAVITYTWITAYMGATTQQAGFLPCKANVAFASGPTVTVDVGNSDFKRKNSGNIHWEFLCNTLVSINY